MSQQINLFNPIFLKQKKHFSATAMLQGLALILLGAIVVMVYARAQLTGLAGEAAATAGRLKSTQAQLAKVKAEYGSHSKSKELEQQIKKVETELKVEQQFLTVARQGNFDKNKGYSEYFRALARQIVDGLWLTGFTISGAGNSIELRGRALQPELVPEYINRLKHESVMTGKAFSALQMEVPTVDAPAKGGGAAAPTKIPAKYVEFRLQSGEGITATGAQPVSMGVQAPGASALPEGRAGK